jgi:deoxyribodipyrimidine photo-lyase
VTHDVDDLFRFEQLPFELDELPATFSKFRKIVEKKPGLVPDPPVEMHELTPCMEQPWPDPVEWTETFDSQLSPRAEVETCGGETQAQRHWTTYLDARALSHYKQTRNAFCGPMQSSHLSAWLAHGCLSARQIWSDTLAYEAREGANESTYWLRFELLWREYFRWYARVSDWTLFRRNGPIDKDVSGDHNNTRFDGWKTGHTNCDIVDAAMRELNETGWMSNRARQLVASHLIYELNLDWRLGAAYFESQLIDFDVASNWGNWAYIAGVGPDPRGGRIFNLNDQADRYDPDQSYRRRWLT